ncbi:MAG TPA: DNA-formamidopyrimidine glycosylase family protein [Nocardioidaceae bacterium]|nr:DNA-formamidopyrimidine glycosylase family protein [Nocardioidaceae bacterium]
MPEGDVVWLTAQRLHQALAGRVLTETDLRVPAHATADLSGATVLDVVSHGKHLLHRLSGLGTHPPLTLHTHLKMEGAWHLYRPRGRWRRPAHQARALLRTDQWQAVGFSLGICELLPTADEQRVVGHLGPDLLGRGWDADEAVRRIRADPGRTVAEALLDQRNLAGIGTLYRSEVLFLRGLHPESPVAAVSDLTAVVSLAQRLLYANRDGVAQSTTGNARRGQQHWVYQRSGQPCRRCGTPIEHGYLGAPSQQRGVFWCPRCQPA